MSRSSAWRPEAERAVHVQRAESRVEGGAVGVLEQIARAHADVHRQSVPSARSWTRRLASPAARDTSCDAALAPPAL